MARQLTPLGIVVVNVGKWVLIPLIVGLIGYKLIGPLIGGSAPEKSSVSKQRSTEMSAPGKKFQSVRETDH